MKPSRHFAAPSRTTRPARGYTLVEILIVTAVIAILGAVAVVGYNRYVAKSQSSELALKFDAVRTNVAVALKAGVVQEQCAAVAGNINPANLKSDYAALDVAFEPVAGGFTPVLRFCAETGSQGIRGVDVAREAHTLLSRSATIGKGAVIGDAAVSFSVGLADGALACKVAPPPGKSTAGCGIGPAASTIAATPVAPVSAPTGAAPGPTVGGVTLMSRITGATTLSVIAGSQRGVAVGTQLVGLYMAGSDVNQLGTATTAQLPRVTTGYTAVGDSGYQYLDAQGVLARLMPGMVANLQARVAAGQGNPWEGGIAVFADGTVARMHKVSNGDPSGTEKDYVYFNVLGGVNAQEGMAIVKGTAAPGQAVQIRNGNTILATVRADSQGQWTFAGAASLASAGQSLNAVAAPNTP